MTTYRLFPSASGPSTATNYSGGYQAGVAFEVTESGLWLDGYRWWVCNTGQDTTPVTFALWQCNTGDSPFNPVVVPDSAVTSGTLTAGTWNYVPLPLPLLLSPSALQAAYVAVCGYTAADGFPLTDGQYGSGDPYAAGITNGPLTAFSDQSGSLPAPQSTSQGLFGTGTASGGIASANFPGMGSSGSGNFWMDIQVDTAAPAGGLYRIWPAMPSAVPSTLTGNDAAVVATEFEVSVPVALVNIWHYSPPIDATALPERCSVWDIGTETTVVDVPGATWSGAAGSKWVRCTNLPSGTVLVPGTKYRVSSYLSTSGAYWFAAAADYWVSGNGASGISSGVMSAPDNASASSPGQGTFNLTSFAFPDSANGEGYWVDAEVTPVASESGLLMAAGII